MRDVLALNQGEWRFPPLEAVTESPILRPDGSLLVVPGYDSLTKVVYAPPPGFRLPSISDVPTPEELAAAISKIGEAIDGFPFVDPASRANTFAMLLTPVIRRVIGDGNVPIGLIDAPPSA